MRFSALDVPDLLQGVWHMQPWLGCLILPASSRKGSKIMNTREWESSIFSSLQGVFFV